MSCGLIVARASNPPAHASHPPARHAPHAASNPATSRLNCCSLIPCTMGHQPNIRTIRITTVPTDARQCRTRNQSKMLTPANTTSIQRKPIWTASNGQVDRGREQKHHIHGISKALPIFGIVGSTRVERPAVVA